MTGVREISLTVNDTIYHLSVEPRRLLCDVLRQDLGLTGTNLSCELGVCGVCTVLMDGAAVRSCLTLAVQADGAHITTVESLADGTELHPLQQAFHENHALQCGFCTPGFLMTLHALFQKTPDASDEDIDEALDGVLCRCTGYQNITKAARAARQMLKQQMSEER
jgi:carbon-monoxide dehydrogenase small subunit